MYVCFLVFLCIVLVYFFYGDFRIVGGIFFFRMFFEEDGVGSRDLSGG